MQPFALVQMDLLEQVLPKYRQYEGYAEMANDEEQKLVAIRVEMPDDLRNRFKSVVVREGKNMKDVVVEFIEKYVEEKEQKPQKD